MGLSLFHQAHVTILKNILTAKDLPAFALTKIAKYMIAALPINMLFDLGGTFGLTKASKVGRKLRLPP